MKGKKYLNIPSYFWILLEHVWKSGYFKGFFGLFFWGFWHFKNIFSMLKNIFCINKLQSLNKKII